MSASPKIGIVTVLYNSGGVLEDFFDSLRCQTFRDFKLYVVNNASPDNSLEQATALASDCPFEVEIIDEPQNWGVAKGNNIGIRRALEDGCPHVLLSNNDIVLRDDTIALLLAGLEETGADMAVPKIYFHSDPELVWAFGGTYHPWNGMTIQYGLKEYDRGQFGSRRECDYSPTCFMLIRAEVFAEVGMMDETYFVYFDDTDFIHRAVRRAGKRLVVIPESRMWHKESVSTGGILGDFSIRYLNRNKWYFVRKNYGISKKIVTFAYMWLYSRIHLRRKFDRRQYRICREAEREGRSLPI